VSDEELLLALSIFADATSEEGVLDMGAAIDDDDLWSRNAELFTDDVEIRFVTPGEMAVEVMAQDHTGIEGLREGWRIWLEPWDRYLITIDEWIDAGDGKLLVLVTSMARMRGTDAEVPQSAAALYFIEGGRIVRLNFYLDQEQARRDAGLV
jgi:ketosteroid isomerase-like protein